MTTSATETLTAADTSSGVDPWVGYTALGVGLTLALAVAAMVIAALVSIVRSRHYSSSGKCLWILMIIALPVLGAIGWLVWGRRAPAFVVPEGPRTRRPEPAHPAGR